MYFTHHHHHYAHHWTSSTHARTHTHTHTQRHAIHTQPKMHMKHACRFITHWHHMHICKWNYECSFIYPCTYTNTTICFNTHTHTHTATDLVCCVDLGPLIDQHLSNLGETLPFCHKHKHTQCNWPCLLCWPWPLYWSTCAICVTFPSYPLQTLPSTHTQTDTVTDLARCVALGPYST